MKKSIKQQKKIKINILYIFSIVIFIFILTISTGYAFFNKSLTINGVASTLEYYEGDALPTEPIKLNTDGNLYHLASASQNGLNIGTEVWEGDTFTLTYKKVFGMVAGTEISPDYTISFANPTVHPYTEGTVTTEILSNTGGMLLDANTRIDKTELKPGEAVTVAMNFHTKITWRHHVETVKATVSYMLQGKRRYFYYIVTYTT